MHVYISDQSLLRNLEEFLRRTGFTAEQCRSHELEVSVPSAPDEAQARRELNVYLATWQALNRGVQAYIIESDGGSQGTREAQQRTRHFRPVDGGFNQDDSQLAMVVWGVVSSEIEQVIEFVGSPHEAQRMLADIVRDEPDWEDVFRIERIELSRESLNQVDRSDRGTRPLPGRRPSASDLLP